MLIGLTGGIGSGKSTIAAMFTARGANLIDADVIAREVVAVGSPVLVEIKKQFGPGVIQGDGTLDRAALGAIVFADEAKKAELERIIHPAIRAMLLRRMAEAEAQQPAGVTIVDIPLLFESGYDAFLERIVVVYVPKAIQVKRVMAREGWDEQMALLRIAQQMDIEQKRERATFVIDNRGSFAESEQQVDAYLQQLGVQ
jgi:dephospho-CoA kinase